MTTPLPEVRIVDNRVLVLALDELYRSAMKRHEQDELLDCARRVARALRLSASDIPADDAPVEGYYEEDERLVEYFRLMRRLQNQEASRSHEVAALPAFQRLQQVLSSPIYGRAQQHGKLFPVGRDAFSQALLDTRPVWTIERLTAAAHASALHADDASLVALAARLRDPVVLAAVRDSVVLYVERAKLSREPPIQYAWQVDNELARAAGRFVDAFNALFDDRLPLPTPDHAERFWHAWNRSEIVGRCVCVGTDGEEPPRYYHWAICRAGGGETVQEFWHSELWTTARYRDAIGGSEKCLAL